MTPSDVRTTGVDVLVPGQCCGKPMQIEPLSFWGGFDSSDGRVIDRFHPAHTISLTGHILFMAHARGSSSGASVLAEAIRLRTAPAAFCLLQRDAIIAIGAMVAQRLYALPCPVLVFRDADRWSDLATQNRLRIDATPDGVDIEA
ncbi:aconitase X swivel domain-containing protein [Pseudohoeflea coraliihabitans]|uniref:DUF126 domain-containing protein n=1 Tax=Pseudohoeflea coraliihabitans TaxID=2860393 RepID=A0ABS6WLQ8_9HYPH|nr:DUF126 domain-containing protein [Pseudohoeflea sp. DP4N28-3]MBW3096907.1 DUF126 domain-containing protein [Pseudohoeflea sp. DP4N28-3]